jgi:hypothetical protein
MKTGFFYVFILRTVLAALAPKVNAFMFQVPVVQGLSARDRRDLGLT